MMNEYITAVCREEPWLRKPRLGFATEVEYYWIFMLGVFFLKIVYL